MIRHPLRLITIALPFLATPALADERGYTVTSFDRIRLEGPYQVTVTSGRGPGARAQGEAAALDTVSVSVIGRTLVIRRDQSAWGGYPGQDRGPVTIAVTTPGLVSAEVAGSGGLRIDRMRGAALAVTVAGSGDLAVGAVEGDRLSLNLNGCGNIQARGRAATTLVSLNGSGAIAAQALQASDATVNLVGSGSITLAVTRAVKVQATGSGDVTIAGAPACTVRRLGSGNVSCGAD